MDCSMPGFSFLHYHPEVAQTHVHWVGNAIQTYHLLSPPSPAALNFSQYQGLSQWVGSSHRMVKVLEPQLQHQSFQWIFGFAFFHDWLVWSPCCPGDSRESFPVPQLESINSSVLSLLYVPTLTSIHDYWKSHSFAYTGFVCKVMCLRFSTLSRFAIAFLPRSKCLLISWLQSPSAVILELKKIKYATVSIFPPSICHGWWDQMPWSYFLNVEF